MTWNKDRKQTKYGHKRREQMTHTTEPWHNSPLPEGVSHAVTVPPGRGGGRSGGPSGQTRTGTQDGDLQSRTDRQRRPWRSWELRRPWRCRELRRPWQCRELRRPWQVVLVALASVPSVRPLQPEPFYPPKKISLGKLGGIRSPPGLNRQDSTKWQESPPGPDRQDRTGQPTGTGSPPGLAWKLRLPLGMTESGALTGSLSNRFHFGDRGAGG